MTGLLSVRSLSVSFSGITALDQVTFDVPAGGITALIGPNGAGKTTLLDCVSGITAYSGEVLLDGVVLAGARPHRRRRAGITRTFQTPSLVEDLTALDNVLLGAHVVCRGRAGGRGGERTEGQVRTEALEWLDRLGVARLAASPVAALPHADRRRVETARALLANPRLLLLDEPAAGLDDGEARALVAACAAGAAGCVLVEHNMGLVMSVADRVVVLAFGQVLAEGPPDRVARDPRVVEAYLGDEVN